VKATLKAMSDFAKAGKKSLYIRNKALDLTQSLPAKAGMSEIAALFDYVQNRVRYVRDINGVETLQTPEQTLEQGSGDCDDKAVLLASLLESIGHPTRFVALGFDGPYDYSHVIVDTRIGGNKWLPLDATEDKPMGWRPPGITAILPWYN